MLRSGKSCLMMTCSVCLNEATTARPNVCPRASMLTKDPHGPVAVNGGTLGVRGDWLGRVCVHTVCFCRGVRGEQHTEHTASQVQGAWSNLPLPPNSMTKSQCDSGMMWCLRCCQSDNQAWRVPPTHHAPRTKRTRKETTYGKQQHMHQPPHTHIHTHTTNKERGVCCAVG